MIFIQHSFVDQSIGGNVILSCYTLHSPHPRKWAFGYWRTSSVWERKPGSVACGCLSRSGDLTAPQSESWTSWSISPPSRSAESESTRSARRAQVTPPPGDRGNCSQLGWRSCSGCSSRLTWSRRKWPRCGPWSCDETGCWQDGAVFHQTASTYLWMKGLIKILGLILWLNQILIVRDQNGILI